MQKMMWWPYVPLELHSFFVQWTQLGTRSDVTSSPLAAREGQVTVVSITYVFKIDAKLKPYDYRTPRSIAACCTVDAIVMRFHTKQ